MRQILLPLILCVSCTSEVSSSVEGLELDRLEEVEYIEPRTERMEVPGLTEAFLPEEQMCFCEWEVWNKLSGLSCVGVVCSMGCPIEYASCRETEICIPVE